MEAQRSDGRAEESVRDESAEGSRNRPQQLTVTVEHFLDVGEQDAEGLYEYYYEGDIYTFDDGTQRLKLRTYTDTPSEASAMGLRISALRRSPLAEPASRYLAARGVTTVTALGPSGTYEVWLPETRST